MSDTYNVQRTSCLKIPKNYPNIDHMRYELLRKNWQDFQQTFDEKKYYLEDDKFIYVPRYYPLSDIYKILNKSSLGDDIEITSKISPRDDRQKLTVDYILNNDNGLIVLQPGEGKTSISIMAISKLKKKQVIFVHKLDLANQWKTRFLEQTDLSDEDVYIVDGDHCDLKKNKNAKIIIITVQTLSRKYTGNDKEFLDDYKKIKFGIAIWDECHTSTGSETFSITSLITNARKTFGLSATPQRGDGNSDIIEFHLGKQFTPQVGTAQRMSPVISVVKFNHGVCEPHDSVRRPHYNYIMHDTAYDKQNNISSYFDKQRYLSKICKSKDFFNVVKLFLNDCLKNNREIIVLTDRIEILKTISKNLPDLTDYGFLISETKKGRDEVLNKKLILQTYGQARDGLDVSRLDTIFLLPVTSNIEQAIGRVTRIKQNKKQPMVILFIDTTCDIIMKRYKKYLEYFIDMNWEVNEFIIDKNSKINKKNINKNIS